MRSYLTPAGQKAADNHAISTIGVSGAILMENAASGSAHCIAMWIDASHIRSQKPAILILCGSGNNGGDGFAIARHLHCMNRFDISIVHIGKIESMSQETKANHDAALALHIPMRSLSESEIPTLNIHADCIIDAILGTGASSELYGLPALLLQRLHVLDVYSSSLCIAIDIPTGIDAETGKANQYAFRAHGTCTMFSEKVGMMLHPGKEYCGEVQTIMLGVPEHIAHEYASVFSIEEQDVSTLITQRKEQSQKYDYGRLLIIAGSRDMPGAPALCAMSAFRSGIGLVEVLTPVVHPGMPPEALVSTIPTDEDGGMNLAVVLKHVQASKDKTHAIVCGPGLGMRAGEEIVNALLTLNLSIPVILDADAIPKSMITFPDDWVLTPHAGECSRMTGIERTILEQSPIEMTQSISQKIGCILHLKSVPACTSDGSVTFITRTGNPGMATAGSGDVLSGMIGAFLARGINSLHACALASMLHGEAGDFARSVFGEESMSASDIIASIPHVIDRTLMDEWDDEQ